MVGDYWNGELGKWMHYIDSLGTLISLFYDSLNRQL
ncbi:hypothetical protein IGJ34_000852 [Enterococcus sp. AZ177]